MLMDKETYNDTLRYEIKKIDYKIAELEEMLEQYSGPSNAKSEIISLINLREQKKSELILFE